MIHLKDDNLFPVDAVSFDRVQYYRVGQVFPEPNSSIRSFRP